jgi:hypothetical protein
MGLVRKISYRRPLIIHHDDAELTIRRLVNLHSGELRFEFCSYPAGALHIGMERIKSSTILSFLAPHTLRIHHGASTLRLEFLPRKGGSSNRRINVSGDPSWRIVPLGKKPQPQSRNKAG